MLSLIQRPLFPLCFDRISKHSQLSMGTTLCILVIVLSCVSVSLEDGVATLDGGKDEKLIES